MVDEKAARPRVLVGRIRSAYDRLPAGVRIFGGAVREFSDHRCTLLAAALAYHVLFSFFPLALVAVGIVGLVSSDPAVRNEVATRIVGIVPLNTAGRDQLANLLTSIAGARGAIGFVGLAGLWWSASGVMGALRGGLNQAFDVTAKRRFWRAKFLDLVLVLGAVVVVGVSFGVTILVGIFQHIAHRLPGVLADAGSWLVDTGGLGIALLFIFTMCLLLYRYVPVQSSRIVDLWPGALVAAVGLEALQYGFAFYLSNFGHYNRVYGTLGGIVAFLFFVYVAGAVFFFGAEVADGYARYRLRR
ncbi:putative ribonuclease BN [Acidothermus cellulolyticus 11B]|uniref:Putative ribonuclease BN n=1 Tax=Acidothermus cellulolyticus (strain ATCC 43068 / DSM 8971 / 11B) TaxID=351607 RepID=A0LRY9_ACIC1|nr:YihY/virulence factor BrkB family protein [Acidothermus cellulolyticus]ABK52199.1 putative ribonuclease BN [Acidothermus cellulolyticus 11B]MCL6551146.1 YihY/virulence factor BrkB family protein [Acidothermus cellulolyticus]